MATQLTADALLASGTATHAVRIPLSLRRGEFSPERHKRPPARRLLGPRLGLGRTEIVAPGGIAAVG